MQWRAALWITGAFKTAPLAGIEAIVGLIPITLYLKKLNGHHHLHYASIPRNHAVNSLLDSQHAKNVSSHKFALSNLTDKQKTKLKSPISDINNCLSEINNSFIPFYFIFSPGLRLVDHFSKKISFYSPLSSDDKELYKNINNLNVVFHQSQIHSHSTAIIADGSIKKSNTTTSVAYIWKDNCMIKQTSLQAMNVTPVEAKLMAICIGLSFALDSHDNYNITVITDSLVVARKIIESHVNPLQAVVTSLALKIKTFLSKDNCNTIQF